MYKLTRTLAAVLVCFVMFAAEVQAGDSAKPCPYPADPINWILKYCAGEAQTDDEIAIQDSACFKKAEVDLNSKNECAIKEKYKKKICDSVLKSGKRYKSLQLCLSDKKIEPFFAGE